MPLTIRRPNRSEFWFTERVFEVGDTYERDGETWMVRSVAEVNAATGKHMDVPVRRAGDAASTG